ncbi:WD40/YVTN/BNR-like repeat-containing protein [Chloroflexota bacterium]
MKFQTLNKLRNLLVVGPIISCLLLLFILLPVPIQANSEADTWVRYPIPQKGGGGGWVMTSIDKSDQTGVIAITVAYDGTIYAATEEISGSPLNGYDLFKSTDDGYSWMPLWQIPADDNPDGNAKVISLVLPRWEEADTLYLATQYNIYKTNNGGKTFNSVGRPPSVLEIDSDYSVMITSFDVTDYLGSYLMVVGIHDIDNGEFGGAFFYDKSKPLTPWADMKIGGDGAGTTYDVLDLVFSPRFTDDKQFVAVVTDEVDTLVTTKVDVADWGSTVGDALLLPGLAATGGSLAFPADYDLDPYKDKNVQYVGLDVGGVNGGIFIVLGTELPNEPVVIPVAYQTPVYSLVATGEAFNPNIVVGDGVPPVTGSVFAPPAVIAGLTDGSVISIATGFAYCPPSVSSAQNACVALGGFHGSDYFVYAGTSGASSSFARSVDTGATFVGTAFISDDLLNITDLAVSPVYDHDSTIYMITEGNSGRSILWRTTNGGNNWDAVLTEGQLVNTTTPVEEFDKVAISPKFQSDTTVFICESGSNARLWRSADNGFRFVPLPSTTGAIGIVESWAIVDNREIRIGDSVGNFLKTTNGGLTWSDSVLTGIGGSIESMILSPDYGNDNTILISGDEKIYISRDDGENWQQPTTSPAELMGTITVAFSPYYADDRIIYAAGASGDGIRRFVVGDNSSWRRIDDVSLNCIEPTPVISCLAIGQDSNGLSTLYGIDHRPVMARVVTIGGGVAAEGGIARCLNPTSPLSSDGEAPVFELVNTELPESVTMSNLWLVDGLDTRRLWSYDSSVTPNVLYIYEDALARSLPLVSPVDGGTSGKQRSSKVSWEETGSAEEYDLWYDTDPGFEIMPVQIYSTVARAKIAPVEGLASGNTYYWRVRVGQSGGSTYVPGTTITFGAPVLSRFSDTWAFTTGLGGAEWHPFLTADYVSGNVSPLPGATGLSLRPNFQWNGAEWAIGYEFQLANNSAFAAPIISRTGTNILETTAYFSEIELDYMTTYYWRVRAVSDTSQSVWGTGVFTTSAEPVLMQQPTQSPIQPTDSGTPFYIWAIIAIAVVMIITLLILIITTRRPVSNRTGLN